MYRYFGIDSLSYLKRLENSECLTTYRQEHNGRIRKYYQITPTGEKRIKDFLDEWEEMKRIYEFVKENHQEEAK
ncbi:MAG: PadR family transcriptional regulator [Blautia sp.]|nr:PadR family transcriptional regulator [Blautia sp.]